MKEEISDPRHDEEDVRVQAKLKEHGNLPRHIAIIMDGDRRWAKEQNLPVTEGHRHGRESVRDIVRACGQLGTEALTLYTFSTENWTRPKTEVTTLMRWLRESLRDETPELHRNNVRLNAIGRLHGLPRAGAGGPRQGVAGHRLQRRPAAQPRAELRRPRRARRRLPEGLAARARDGAIDPGGIEEEDISAALYTGGIPDPDLLIRCSGEMRLSNFLPWQMIYTEIWFTPVYWPDFRRHHLYRAIRDFQQRQRRFGGA